MNRTGRGQFQKGRSGNAGGRPKAALSLRDEAQKHMGLAMATLVKAAKKGSVTAAIAILDRGFGRPPQEITGGISSSPLPATIILCGAPPMPQGVNRDQAKIHSSN
jgi:hypothetical protein